MAVDGGGLIWPRPPGTVLEGRDVYWGHRVASRGGNTLDLCIAGCAPVALEKLLGRKQKVTLGGRGEPINMDVAR